LDPERGGFDAERGVNHERTVIKDESGTDAEVDLWTTCFTPRELRLLAARAGLEPTALWSVRPGEYAERAPDLEHEEFLLVARRPPRASSSSSPSDGLPALVERTGTGV